MAPHLKKIPPPASSKTMGYPIALVSPLALIALTERVEEGGNTEEI